MGAVSLDPSAPPVHRGEHSTEQQAPQYKLDAQTDKRSWADSRDRALTLRGPDAVWEGLFLSSQVICFDTHLWAARTLSSSMVHIFFKVFISVLCTDVLSACMCIDRVQCLRKSER